MHNFKKPEFILFIVILVISLFFRIKIIHDLPMGTTTTEYGLQGFDDEPAHFNYTKYLLKNHTLPVEQISVTDSSAFELNQFEYHQPPLYYAAIALICSWSDISTAHAQLLAGRYSNLIISFFSFYIIFLIFIQIGWKKEYAWAGISVIALLGSHVYQNSLFSNDALSWLLMWWLFYFIQKKEIYNWLWLTLLLTLAHYTKSNIFVIYPVLLWFFYQEYKKSKSKTLIKSLIILLVPLILASPWYIRNHLLYDSYLMLSGSEWHFVSCIQSSLIKLAHAPYSFLFKMYFDPPKHLLSSFNYVQYLVIFPSFLIGLWHSKKSLKSNYNMQILLLMFITMITAYLWLAIPTGFTEGRMLFPALPVIIYFICEPWFIFNKEKKLQLYMIFALICLLFLPSYIIGFYL